MNLNTLGAMGKLLGVGAVVAVAAAAFPRPVRFRELIVSGVVVLVALGFAVFSAVESSWYLWSIAAGAAAYLCRETEGRGLVAFAFFPIALGAVGPTSAIVRLGPTLGAIGIVLTIALAVALNILLNKRPDHPLLVEALLLLLFVASGLAAAPKLAFAWQRSAIAREGQDQAQPAAFVWWAVVPLIVAFFAGFVLQLARVKRPRLKGLAS